MNNYLDLMAARSPVRDFTNRGEDFDRCVEAMEADIFAAKLASLTTLVPVYRLDTTGIKVPALWDVIQEINGNGMEALARAVRDGSVEEAGKEILRLVREELRKQARDEAEELCGKYD